MSDPYDPNRMARNMGDSNRIGMWAGIALLTLVILGGLAFFYANPPGDMASNPAATGQTPPSTTGSAPSQ
jgi:hypothetical protein